MSAPLLAVLDYGIGNLHSAHQSFNHVGADARLTADPALIADADAVVLPGVGHFGACMRALRETGLDEIAVAAEILGAAVHHQVHAEVQWVLQYR